MEQSEDVLDGLEERLQSHAKAFESLLALTPAREYYGSQIVDGNDPSEQWNRKKQTKEEKRAAKLAKLDPANQKSALDVMKERERKRKRELGMEDESVDAATAAANAEHDVEAGSKRQKVEVDEDADEAKRRAKAERKKEKRQAAKEKRARKQAKAEAKKAAKQERDLADVQAEETHHAAVEDEAEREEEDRRVKGGNQSAQLDDFDASGFAGLDDDHTHQDDVAAESSSVPSSPAVDSPAFDIATIQSPVSSSSSILPPSNSEQPPDPHTPKQALPEPKLNTSIPTPTSAHSTSKPLDLPSGTSSPKIHLPDIDQAQLQERLRARIEELRLRRKADGPDGKPAKSRQELLDQRRKKEEQRKAAKKEQRRQAKEEEQRKREEQLRGSGSPLSADFFSPRSPHPPSTATTPAETNSFSFSRLAFEDGTSTTPDLSTLTEPRKRKGPQDPLTALTAAQHKHARVAGYDAGKQAAIAAQDGWRNAKKRAHGERVRDDTSLLKKALKRKEKQKSKSERLWQDREQAVEKGKEARQKKREANLLKRREEKGGAGAGAGGKKKKSSNKGKHTKGQGQKGRPGFEGRFKA